MRLGFIMGDVLYKHPGGEYYGNTEFLLFLNAFRSFVEDILVIAPVARDRAGVTRRFYNVSGLGFRIAELPPFDGFAGFIARFPFIATRVGRVIEEHVASCDLVIVKENDLFGHFACWVACKFSKPVAMLVTGDIAGVVRVERTGFLKVCALGLAKLYERLDRSAIRRGLLLFVAGGQLYSYYRRFGSSVRTYLASPIGEQDLVSHTEPSEKRIDVLYVGGLRKSKGVHVLLEAVHVLSERGMVVNVTLVGDGPYESKLRRIVRRLGLTAQVSFAGYLSDRARLAQIYRSAKVFVLPSYSEGSPKVLLEAMGWGTPVIATRVGGVPHLIDPGINGLLVEPGDVMGLAESMALVLTNSQLAQRLQQGGTEFMKGHTAEREAWRMLCDLLNCTLTSTQNTSGTSPA